MTRVKAVINLEAAGAGGPALAFQIGSEDLAYAYAQAAPYPHMIVSVRNRLLFDCLNCKP